MNADESWRREAVELSKKPNRARKEASIELDACQNASSRARFGFPRGSLAFISVH